MSAQIKVNILLVGEEETGKNDRGGIWFRRTCQMFTGEVAGNIPVYGTQEELAELKTGPALVEVTPRAGNNGRLEMRLGKVTPTVQSKPAQAA